MVDEILQKLIQSDLLSEETRAEISEQWTASVSAFKNQVREEVTNEVKLQLSEQWIQERDELVAKVDEFVAEALKNEVAELHGDIDRFRDLEAEYAEKIVEEKHRLAEEVASDLDELVEKINDFFEIRLGKELEELKEDLQVVKQNQFGRQIYEAFAATFATAHVDEDSATSQLKTAKAELAEARKALAAAEDNRAQLVRESTMEKLLANLSGKKREQMEMVLKNIETSRLEESYKYFIGKILKEDVGQTTLSEGKADDGKTTVVTGDAPLEQAPAPKLDESLQRLKRLAGV